MIIDCHVHLWKKQNGFVNGRKVYSVGNGKSNFGGEVRQMMPPYMTDGENTVEYTVCDYASGTNIMTEDKKLFSIYF